MSRSVFYLLAISVTILLLSLASVGKASCEFVWKPGDVMYVDAGHHTMVYVESEDVETFKHGQRVPQALLPTQFKKDELNDAIDKEMTAKYCGEYKEISDEDLD